MFYGLNVKPISYHTNVEGLRYLSFDRKEIQRFLDSGERRGVAVSEDGEVCGFLYPGVIRSAMADAAV